MRAATITLQTESVSTLRNASGDARREDSHDHRSLRDTQAVIRVQIAKFPTVDP
jgi:hypothetical protein